MAEASDRLDQGPADSGSAQRDPVARPDRICLPSGQERPSLHPSYRGPPRERAPRPPAEPPWEDLPDRAFSPSPGGEEQLVGDGTQGRARLKRAPQAQG